MTVTTEQEIKALSGRINTMDGPVLIELRVRIDSRDNLGRPTTTPIQNKEAFMTNLKN